MAEVKWIKLTTDMFDNRKIKHLRRLPEGNNIVLIWIMLLTLAGRCNSDGLIFLTENVPYTTKMLADELDFEESTVKLALEALEQLGMIHFDGFLCISGWEEHQSIEGMDKIRLQNRIRKQRQRERKELLLSNVSRDSHVTVTQGHATDKEKDIEEDIEKENTLKSIKEKPEKSRFKPPTVDEVRAYCTERKNNVDAETFVDFYTAKGWKVGNNPMKDWKAAVRTWEKRDAPAKKDFDITDPNNYKDVRW